MWKGFIRESIRYINPKGLKGWIKFIMGFPKAWLKFMALEKGGSGMKRLGLGLVVLGLVGLMVSGIANADIYTDFQTAYMSFAKDPRDHAGAILKFQNILATYTTITVAEKTWVLETFGQCYQEQAWGLTGDAKATAETNAITKFRETIATGLGNSYVKEAYFHIGQIYQGNKKYTDAIGEYKQVMGYYLPNAIDGIVTCLKEYTLIEADLTKSKAVYDDISRWVKATSLDTNLSTTVTERLIKLRQVLELQVK